ncbi:hypothetical protein LM602_06815 [Candidatus Acetothermia bacterium]|jgi:hypothetical protein|nr:hypothetical protein [Candidatus Acetothermia bacterium]MCI2432246.1 hypothetical protein [Candidatus Acetothermia bacterium]MCI2436502.1 hypothetical protein [Candidatus Acetothermia bacterium]
MKTRIFLSLVVLWGVTASAQTFDVTISASLPFTAAGPSTEGFTAAVEAGTDWEGWKIKARADLGLMPFKFSTLTLTSSTTFYGISIHDVAVIDFQNPVQERLTLSTTVDQFQLSAVFTYSYPLVEFWKINFGDVTVSAAATSAEGVRFSSATTMTLQGFAKQVFSVGLSVQGVSISRTTELTKAGLATERWHMALSLGGFSLTRTTVYTAEGFASDTFTVGKQFGEYAFMGRTLFDKTGWASKTIMLSTVYQQIDLSTTLVMTPVGFKGGSLNMSKTITGIKF